MQDVRGKRCLARAFPFTEPLCVPPYREDYPAHFAVVRRLAAVLATCAPAPGSACRRSRDLRTRARGGLKKLPQRTAFICFDMRCNVSLRWHYPNQVRSRARSLSSQPAYRLPVLHFQLYHSASRLSTLLDARYERQEARGALFGRFFLLNLSACHRIARELRHTSLL